MTAKEAQKIAEASATKEVDEILKLTTNLNMKKILEKLADRIAQAKKLKEDLDSASWGDQEGILITANEAKAIIEALNEVNKILSSPVLVAEKFTLMMEDWKPRAIDEKSGWKNNAKILAEIVTAINNDIYIEDESAEMEKIDIVLEWIKKRYGK